MDAMLRDMANAAAMEIPLSQGLRPKFLLYKREGPENILFIKNFWMVNSSSYDKCYYVALSGTWFSIFTLVLIDIGMGWTFPG